MMLDILRELVAVESQKVNVLIELEGYDSCEVLSEEDEREYEDLNERHDRLTEQISKLESKIDIPQLKAEMDAAQPGTLSCDVVGTAMMLVALKATCEPQST